MQSGVEVRAALNAGMVCYHSSCRCARVTVRRTRGRSDRKARIHDARRELVIRLGAGVVTGGIVGERLETAWQRDAVEPRKPVVGADQHDRERDAIRIGGGLDAERP